MTISLALSLELSAIVWMLRRARGLHRELSWLAGSAAAFMALTFLVRAALFSLGVYPALQSLSEPLEPPLAAVLLATLAFVVATVALVGLAGEQHRNDALYYLRRDSLTGFLTRTAFQEMEERLERQTRQTGCGVVLIDLDRFKPINDHHGHEAGDRVLAHAARLIANTMRLTDLAVRYGGDEFCVVLRDCTEAEALQFAERVIKLASQQRVRLADGSAIGFTLSAGVAVRSPSPMLEKGLFLQLLRRADDALYKAKRAGRNQYRLADGPAEGH